MKFQLPFKLLISNFQLSFQILTIFSTIFAYTIIHFNAFSWYSLLILRHTNMDQYEYMMSRLILRLEMKLVLVFKVVNTTITLKS